MPLIEIGSPLSLKERKKIPSIDVDNDDIIKLINQRIAKNKEKFQIVKELNELKRLIQQKQWNKLKKVKI
jgi:hypothetical protein